MDSGNAVMSAWGAENAQSGGAAKAGEAGQQEWESD